MTGRLGEMAPAARRAALSGAGLRLQVGEVVYRLRDRDHLVGDHLARLYGDHWLVDAADTDVDDTALTIFRRRRTGRPDQVMADIDGPNPINPLPLAQANLMVEVAMNWAIAGTNDFYLVLHGAVVARNGIGLVLPAVSGSGKSTLAAGLMCRGWRLLSDEFTLVGLDDGLLYPLPRPVSLKNQSIEVARRLAPGDAVSPTMPATVKGDLAYLRPSRISIDDRQPIKASSLLAPAYSSGSGLSVVPMSRAEMFMRLAMGAGNYDRLGHAGFEHLHRLVTECDCASLTYGQMDEAMDWIEKTYPATMPTARVS